MANTLIWYGGGMASTAPLPTQAAQRNGRPLSKTDDSCRRFGKPGRLVLQMTPKFFKGCSVALIAYLVAFWALLNLAVLMLLAVASVVIAWLSFAGYRLWRLASAKAYRTEAAEWDREDFGFWLGAVVSSLAAIALLLMTPVRVR